MSLLRTIGIGRLTADPEVKTVKSGKDDVSVAEFTVACDADFGKEGTDFVNCVVWRKLAETAANHLAKGRQIYFEGRPRTRSYENKEGQKVYVHEVVVDNFQFLDSGNKGAKDEASASASGAGKSSSRRVPF